MNTPKCQTIASSRGHPIHYLSLGPSSGPLIVWVHGWPDRASTWLPQLHAFALLGFHCVAADTCGYGGSHISRTVSDYSCENLVADQLDLLTHLGRDKAIWVGHDWGCAIVWSLAAHHQDKCTGVVNLCVPYRMLEMGLEQLLETVNREIYPEDEYPHGQWDYQVAYERDPDACTKQMDDDVEKVIKLLYSRGQPESYGKPARTSSVTKDGGWFGNKRGSELMDLPLEMTVFSNEGLEHQHEELVQGLKQHGFWGATAYYRNHKANREYNLNARNDAILEMPVLFIDAKYDAVCASNDGVKNKHGDDVLVRMRTLCKNYTETSVEGAHWVALEKYMEVNAAIANWLVKKVPGWPGPAEIKI